jgi:hypothetical protein
MTMMSIDQISIQNVLELIYQLEVELAGNDQTPFVNLIVLSI